MAKAPSIDSEIDKAQSAAQDLQAQTLRLFDRLSGLAKPDQPVDGSAEDADLEAVDELARQYCAEEIAVAELVHHLSHRVDGLYAAFDAVDAPTRFERFMSFFSRRKATGHQALGIRKVSLSGRLNEVLSGSDRVCGLLAQSKAFGLDLQRKCEPVSLSFMDRRNRLGDAVETARHELKEQNALLATVQWKAGNTTDEARSAALLAERDALSLAVENAEATYRSVRAAHDGVDRCIQLFETFCEQVNDRLSASSLLLNKLSLEMERAIQLQIAVSGSADELVRKMSMAAQPSPSHLAGLVQLHANHSISLDEIGRRKSQCDESFFHRYSLEKGRVTGRANSQ